MADGRGAQVPGDKADMNGGTTPGALPACGPEVPPRFPMRMTDPGAPDPPWSFPPDLWRGAQTSGRDDIRAERYALKEAGARIPDAKALDAFMTKTMTDDVARDYAAKGTPVGAAKMSGIGTVMAAKRAEGRALSGGPGGTSMTDGAKLGIPELGIPGVVQPPDEGRIVRRPAKPGETCVEEGVPVAMGAGTRVRLGVGPAAPVGFAVTRGRDRDGGLG